MPNGSHSPSPDLQLAILRFWAEAVSIVRNFRQSEIRAIPELAAAIKAAELLPSAIGWGDEDDDTLLGRHPRSGKPN
jgi:hypothetical protein